MKQDWRRMAARACRGRRGAGLPGGNAGLTAPLEDALLAFMGKAGAGGPLARRQGRNPRPRRPCQRALETRVAE